MLGFFENDTCSVFAAFDVKWKTMNLKGVGVEGRKMHSVAHTALNIHAPSSQ